MNQHLLGTLTLGLPTMVACLLLKALLISAAIRYYRQHEDPDNLFAMYLLYKLVRYRVRVDEQTLRLELTEPKAPLPYAEAETLATEAALFDSDRYASNSKFIPKGTRIGADAAAGDDRRLRAPE